MPSVFHERYWYLVGVGRIRALEDEQTLLQSEWDYIHQPGYVYLWRYVLHIHSASLPSKVGGKTHYLVRF